MADQYVEQPVMMRTTAPNPQLSNAVLLVERERSPGVFAPHGTAFLLRIGHLRWAVTARHIVQQGMPGDWKSYHSGLALRVASPEPTPAAQYRKVLNSTLFDGQDMFVFHSDPAVDAAVFPTYGVKSYAERSVPLAGEMLQADNLVAAGEDVHLFGFPAAYGSSDATPVVRSGTIAYKLSRHEYLLDVRSWHGDSGGLVCSKPYFGVPVGQSGYQWQGGGKIIGVLNRYDPPRLHGLPAELENFRVITSAQAVIEILATPKFEALNGRLQALAEQELSAANR